MNDPKQAVAVIDNLPPATTSMVEVISRAARDPSVDMDKMERLLAMQERITARDAEMAFISAMCQVQSRIRYVKKDAKNPSTNSHYTRLETLNKAVMPIATECGFSLSFGTADCSLPDSIRVTCTVLHSGGHSKTFQVDVPIDILGAKGNPNKTKTHGYGSALSYGRRYLTLLIFNVSTGEDDDGNSASAEGNNQEILIGLKTMLWNLLKKHLDISTWDQARQWLTDEDIIEPEMDMKALQADADRMRAAMAKAKAKLEAKQ